MTRKEDLARLEALEQDRARKDKTMAEMNAEIEAVKALLEDVIPGLLLAHHMSGQTPESRINNETETRSNK